MERPERCLNLGWGSQGLGPTALGRGYRPRQRQLFAPSQASAPPSLASPPREGTEGSSPGWEGRDSEAELRQDVQGGRLQGSLGPLACGLRALLCIPRAPELLTVTSLLPHHGLLSSCSLWLCSEGPCARLNALLSPSWNSQYFLTPGPCTCGSQASSPVSVPESSGPAGKEPPS